MRLPALVACGVVMFCLALPALAPAEADAAGSGLDRAERKVIRLVNQIRARHGLRRLKASRALSRAASRHSGDMVRRDFFGHASSNGTSMKTRVKTYTQARWVGENLAIVSGRGSAGRVVRMWMASAGHRQVILDRNSRRIGVGKRRGAVGSFRGTVYTADFASR